MPPCSPTGQMTGSFGPAVAPANRFRPPANDKASEIDAIFGRTWPAWRQNADPLASWASKLQARLAMYGSIELPMIWKERATPAGRPIFQLSPLARHTGARGYGGSHCRTSNAAASVWPTPQACEATSRSGKRKAELLLQGILRRTMHTVTLGQEAPRSSAPTVRRVVTNPAFAGWLMGYPEAWSTCGPQTNRMVTRRMK